MPSANKKGTTVPVSVETVVDLMDLLEREFGEPVDDLGVAVRMLLKQTRSSERSLQAAASEPPKACIYAAVYVKAFVPGGSVMEEKVAEQIAREAACRAVGYMTEDLAHAGRPLPNVDNDKPLADGVDVLTREAVDAMTAIYSFKQMDAARAVISSVIDGRLADAHSALLALARRVKR